MPPFADLLHEYEALDDREDRYRFLIELGRQLPPMPPALRTEASKVRGCSAQVWVYPVEEGGALRFHADSDAHITKGIVALIVALVDGRAPADLATLDIEACLAPFALSRELSSNRTQGIPNMIALIRDTARRVAA